MSDASAVTAITRRFFARCAEISAASPPSAPNAANGYWTHNTVNDPELMNLVASPGELTGDLRNFHREFAVFQSHFLAAFAPDPVHSDLKNKPSLVLPAVESLLSKILAVVGDVWDVWRGSKKEREAAILALREDVTTLWKAINALDNLTQGDHASGYVSKNMNKAASDALVAINNALPADNQTDAGKLADVMRIVCTQLIALPTEGHDPWLLAEWQISFEGIMKGAAAGMAAADLPSP